MAVSLENKRRSVTLPEVTWAELEAEADETKQTVSEVLLHYLTEARMTPETAYVKMERRLDQFAHELSACVSKVTNVLTVLDVWMNEQKSAPSTSEHPTASQGTAQQQALQEWYAANQSGETTTPVPPSVKNPRVYQRLIYWIGRLVYETPRGCLLIILSSVGGVWAVTQWSVAQVPRGDRGPALMQVSGYALYPPYQTFVWWIMGNTGTAERLLPAMGLSMAMLLGGILLLRLMGGRSRAGSSDRYISGARWATREDTKRNGWL